MSRYVAATLVAVMLMVVLGQGLVLRSLNSAPVVQVVLQESRLVAFLQDIRQSNPTVHDSTVLNLRRLRDAQAQGLDVQIEEALVAERLLARLLGTDATSQARDAQSKQP